MFEGQWCRGVRQGKGKITYLDGSFYRGDFNKVGKKATSIYFKALTYSHTFPINTGSDVGQRHICW